MMNILGLALSGVFFGIAMLMLVVGGDFPLAAPLVLVVLGVVLLGDTVAEMNRSK